MLDADATQDGGILNKMLDGAQDAEQDLGC